MNTSTRTPGLKAKVAPLLFAGALASAVLASPFAAAGAPVSASPNPPAAIEILPAAPGGDGCVGDACGSGGVDDGPGNAPGGQGCVPGVGCGEGGLEAGPDGQPGGSGCIPGIGCGSGHA